MTETSPRLPADTTCWMLSNGMAGYEIQGIGIAEALGLTPELKRVTPIAPYSWLAPWGPAGPDANVAPPWPDLLIAGGRQAVPYARMIAKKAGGRTLTVMLQHPRTSLKHFDLVWAPVHDRLSGPNVISTLTAPNRITPEKLISEAERLAPRYAALPERKVAVVIGGTNKVYDLGPEPMARLAAKLKALAEEEQVGLMITTSRRTEPAATEVLKQALEGVPHVIYDAINDAPEDNPYPGILGLAEATLVTCDSHNMVGEATTTGRPVHVIELEGGSRKFREFLDALYVNGAARPFNGSLDVWSYPPLNATQEIAAKIIAAFAARTVNG